MISGFFSTQATFISRLHPFSKMIVGATCTIYALILNNPLALATLLLFLLGVAVIARIRVSGRRAMGLLFFFLVFGCLNFCVSDSPAKALAYCLRMAVFMAAIPILSATTVPQDMVRALTRVRLPSGVLVALLLIWRFFPVLAAEAVEMRQASVLRGKAGGSPLTRLYRGLLVPLAFAVVEYSDRISLALEIRGFSPGETRSCYAMPLFGARDSAYVCVAAMFWALAAGFQWGGLA